MTGQQATLNHQADEQFVPVIARLARAMKREAEKARDLDRELIGA